MKFRAHRGSLSDSMKTVIEVNSVKDILESRNYLNGFKSEDVIIEKYGFDERIGWDTYIVVVKGFGVVGFLDGDLRQKSIIPTHEEIMTKWWSCGVSWHRVVVYYPSKNEYVFESIGIGVFTKKQEDFIGLESADIPPEK